MFYFLISLRNLKKRKLRTFLTLVGVVLGVAVILAVNASGQSTVQSYERLINTVSGKSELEVVTSSPSGFDEKILKKIEKVAAVDKAYPSITRYSLLFKKSKIKNKPPEKISFMLMSIDAAIDRNLRDYQVTEGSFLKSRDKGVLLVGEFAKDNGLKVGNTIGVLSKDGPANLKIKGLLRKVGPASQENGAVGFITLSRGQELFGMSGKITKADVKLKNGRNIDKAKEALQRKLGEGYDTQRPASRSRDAERLLKSIKIALDFFGLVAIFVGGFLIFNTFSMNLAERSNEIASLRSIGASRLQIMVLILTEAVVLGIAGSAAGIFLGRTLAQAVFSTMSVAYRTYMGDIIISRQSVLIAASVGLLVSFLSAFYPARKAGRISPITVFKERAMQKSVWVEKRGWLIGVAFIGLAAALAFYPASANRVTLMQIANFGVLLGITLILPVLIKPLSFIFQKPLAFIKTSKLASRNLPRAKLRSALTISALLVGIIMVIGIEAMNISYQRTFEQWVFSSINVDLFIRPKLGYGLETGKIVPMDAGLEDKIARVEGVEAVTPVRFLTAKVKGKEITLLANKPESARRILNHYFLDGNSKDAYDQMAKGSSVIISTAMRDNFGYKLGEQVPIKTAVGIRKFKIAGVISDFIDESGSAYISWSDLKKYFKAKDVDVFDIDIEKGFTLKEVKSRLEDKFSKYGVFVMTTTDLNNQINKEITGTFYLMDAIVLIALIVAAFGVINTLTMSVIERKREIGILRALGAYSGQVGIIILAEALIMGIIGAGLGAVGGLFAAYFMIIATSVLAHFPISYIVPVNAIILVVAFAILLSMAAGLYPALKAAKTNIVQALQYE